MPTLVFEIEDGSRVMAPLDGRTTIGSAEGNDIVAERAEIAAHHAEVFTNQDNTWWVRDNNSPAGTFVNGSRVTTQRLSPGDLLLFGSISARFVLETATHDTPPAPESPVTPDPEIEKKKLEIAKLDEALTKARAEFEQTIKEQESRLATLREEAARLEPAMGSKRKELSGLDAALAKAMADLEKTTRDEQERIAALRSEAAGLEAAVGEHKHDLASLAATLAKAREEMEKAAKVHESRLTELQQHASGLETDIGRKKQEITGLTGALHEAEKIAGEKRRKNEELAKSVAEAARLHEVLSHQVRTLSEQQRTKLSEMERLEQDLASLESRKMETAGVLEEHEAGRLRAEKLMKQTAAQREQADAELKKLGTEKTRLTDEVRRLGEQSAGFNREISKLEIRKSDARANLDELEKSRGAMQSQLNDVTKSLADATAQHRQISTDLKEEEARLRKLRSEADAAAEQIKAEQSEIASHTSTKENLIALNKQLQAEVADVGNRLAELSRMEERLLESRREMQRTESAHLSLQVEHDELTRKHAVVRQSVQDLEAHVLELNNTQDRLEQALPALKSEHAEAENSRRLLNEEIARLRADVTDGVTRLADTLQKSDQAQRHLAELDKKCHELEAVSARLGDVQDQLQKAELEKNRMESQIEALAQASLSSQARLTEIETAGKSTGIRVSQLQMKEAELQNTIKQLGDEQQCERERFEGLRLLSQDAERETERQKERLNSQLSEMREEIARLESRLVHARNGNAELDQLYEKLGRMPDASPEAREAWLEIQRRKNAIAEQLPAGIQVRPQSRPTVVPRAR